MDQGDGMEVDSASGFMTRTLMVLKGKTSPETRLSTEELQVHRSDQHTGGRPRPMTICHAGIYAKPFACIESL